MHSSNVLIKKEGIRNGDSDGSPKIGRGRERDTHTDRKNNCYK